MIPQDLLYSSSHEWVRVDGDEAVIGITHFAQEQLGDLTFVETPAVGARLTPGGEAGTVESVKAASEIYCPVAGEVVAVNAALESTPELVNQDPYGEGWLFRVRLTQPPQDLLSASAYAEHIAAQAH
ncbi:MAG: glycine cleavage system protein GcvH [Desulfomicrobiaceae bacterium]|nr:glycine cleavage system protein GcvH [Desulfomicrobiaceae bacterium]